MITNFFYILDGWKCKWCTVCALLILFWKTKIYCTNGLSDTKIK